MSPAEFFVLAGEALRFAQSPEALRGRAAFCRGRGRRLLRKADKIERDAANKPERRRKRMLKRAERIRSVNAIWWFDRSDDLTRRATEREERCAG